MNDLLSVIIVSYNTKELTKQTIRSVLVSSPGSQVIVIDNNSHDGSVEFLQKEFGKKITCIENRENVGFARANNQGINQATGEYILLLNSDTQVLDEALKKMVLALDTHPEFGVISCELQNPDGSYQPQGGALPTLVNVAAWWLWPFPGQMPLVKPYQNSNLVASDQSLVTVGWVAGTAMMVRREVIDAIGGLDEQIFMYAEDVEYCQRARRADWRIGLVAGAKIEHIGSASSSKAKATLGEVKGLLYLFKKSFPLWQLPVLRLVFAAGALLRSVLFGILGRNEEAKALYASILHISFGKIR
ncbi:MAG TPA: glycosyltransferase family 2 protein [Patescibacteria group bacterium]|nr:glycosyltransferase family 2 protein [Patescibacteria group bacterium]